MRFAAFSRRFSLLCARGAFYANPPEAAARFSNSAGTDFSPRGFRVCRGELVEVRQIGVDVAARYANEHRDALSVEERGLEDQGLLLAFGFRRDDYAGVPPIVSSVCEIISSDAPRSTFRISVSASSARFSGAMYSRAAEETTKSA